MTHVDPLTPGVTAGVADAELRHVDPALIRVEAIGWWVFLAIVLAVFAGALLICWIAGVAAWVLGVIAGGGTAVSGLIVWATVRMPRATYKRTMYAVSAHGIEIRQGVVWRSITCVPRARVQHIDVRQGPVMRHFGLAALVIHTAGTEAASVTLPGLAHADAMRIRDYLVRKDDEGSDGDGV